MMSDLFGYKIVRSPFPSPGTMFLAGDALIVGPPKVSEEIYRIFHQGDMLKWYEYIGEGKGSVHDILFGYPDAK